MNKRSLSQLYQNMTKRFLRSNEDVLNAETLVQLTQNESSPLVRDEQLAEISKSAVGADLLRFAQALAPTSQALSEELASFDWEAPANVVPFAPLRQGWNTQSRRRVTNRRSLWAAGLAAALVLGVVHWHPLNEPSSTSAAWQTELHQMQPVSDEIFSWSSERAVATQSTQSQALSKDEIFHSDFRGG